MPDERVRSVPRIAVGGILTECNHLGGVPIDLAVYETSGLYRGVELFKLQTSVVGGMLRELQDASTDIIPLIFASACAGGPISADCYAQLRGEWHQRLRDACPVDGVLLPLHGSALVDGNDDPEGDLIHAARLLVGPDIPIIATLDLHAHVTARMVRHADALVAWETYPHHDQFQTGQRAGRLLLETIAGNCRPTMAMSKVPVITSAINGSTTSPDPFAELMHFTKSLESRSKVLSTSLFLVHPYMDCDEMGSGGLVITDNEPDLARTLSRQIAERYWQKRHELEPESCPPLEAIEEGCRMEGGPIILVETADCCGGGAAGDSIATLSALVDHASDRFSIVPVVDPEAAAACHASGEGIELALVLGHRRDPRWGQSREFRGTVEHLSDGQFVYTGGQWEGESASMGPTAVFRIGSVRVLITSRATYDWSDEQVRAVGLDPQVAKFIVAKNPMNYRWAYGDMAKGVFILDTPGPTPPTLLHVPFHKLRRPYFPVDSDIPGLEPTVLD